MLQVFPWQHAPVAAPASIRIVLEGVRMRNLWKNLPESFRRLVSSAWAKSLAPGSRQRHMPPARQNSPHARRSRRQDITAKRLRRPHRAAKTGQPQTFVMPQDGFHHVKRGDHSRGLLGPAGAVISQATAKERQQAPSRHDRRPHPGGRCRNRSPEPMGTARSTTARRPFLAAPPRQQAAGDAMSGRPMPGAAPACTAPTTKELQLNLRASTIPR